MIVFAFFIWVMSVLELNFDALWDKEAFETGKSNHLYKHLRIIAWGFMSVFVGMVGYQYGLLHENDFGAVFVCLLAALIYPLTRYSYFDTILNFKRGKDLDYKTGPNWIKVLCTILVLVDYVILHKIA